MALHKCDECGNEISTSAKDTITYNKQPAGFARTSAEIIAEAIDAQGHKKSVGSKCPKCLAPHNVAFASYYKRLAAEGKEAAEEQARQRQRDKAWAEEQMNNSSWFYICPRCLKQGVNPYDESMCCLPLGEGELINVNGEWIPSGGWRWRANSPKVAWGEPIIGRWVWLLPDPQREVKSMDGWAVSQWPIGYEDPKRQPGWGIDDFLRSSEGKKLATRALNVNPDDMSQEMRRVCSGWYESLASHQNIPCFNNEEDYKLWKEEVRGKRWHALWTKWREHEAEAKSIGKGERWALFHALLWALLLSYGCYECNKGAW